MRLNKPLIGIVAVMTAITFAVDLTLPLGVACGAFYMALVMVGWWFQEKWTIFFLAALASALTVAGYFLSPQGGDYWIAGTNRLYTILAIWLMAVILSKLARQNRALSENARLVESLHRATNNANKARGVEEAMHSCLREICSYTKWPIGHVYELLSDNPETLVPTDIWYLCNTKRSISMSQFVSFRDVTMETEFKVGVGLPGMVFATGKPFWISDIATDDNFPRARMLNEICLKSAFAVPVMADGKVAAVIEFFSEDMVETNETMIRISNDIGIQLGLIIERHRAEAKLRQAKEKADAANRAKSEFLTSMSHELRTPLNAVLGFAQMLQFDPRNPVSATQNRYVESIISGGHHLLELVNSILDLARIEADQISLSVEDVNANKIVADCVALTLPLGETRKITIVDQFSNGLSVDVKTDRVRIKQILINLLSNAVKYNKYGGTVTINGEKTSDGFLRMSVTDGGIGIAKADRPMIFQMFSRPGTDPMIAREGAGIGLAVSKMLVERMGGSIGFESEEKIGSTFWFKLPLASNRDVLIWTNTISTGVDAIDKDHQVIFSLLNKTLHADDADLDRAIGELVSYTRYHFMREEAVMEACGYPNFEKHRDIHRNFIAQVADMTEQWHKDYDHELPRRISRFMHNWLVDHIVNYDSQLSPYAKRSCQDVRLALDIIKSDTLSFDPASALPSRYPAQSFSAWAASGDH